MSLNTNNLSLIHPEKISVPLHIDIPKREINSPNYSIPELTYRNFTYYNNYCNDYVKEKQELKLPDIKVHVQENYQPLFYKRTEFKKNEQLREVKKVTPLKVGQMAKYGQMSFVYQGGF